MSLKGQSQVNVRRGVARCCGVSPVSGSTGFSIDELPHYQDSNDAHEADKQPLPKSELEHGRPPIPREGGGMNWGELLPAVRVRELDYDVLLRHIDPNDCIAAHLLNHLAVVLRRRSAIRCRSPGGSVPLYSADFLEVAPWSVVSREYLHLDIRC